MYRDVSRRLVFPFLLFIREKSLGSGGREETLTRPASQIPDLEGPVAASRDHLGRLAEELGCHHLPAVAGEGVLETERMPVTNGTITKKFKHIKRIGIRLDAPRVKKSPHTTVRAVKVQVWILTKPVREIRGDTRLKRNRKV